jgi:DNA polymerase delta subunit 2
MTTSTSPTRLHCSHTPKWQRFQQEAIYKYSGTIHPINGIDAKPANGAVKKGAQGDKAANASASAKTGGTDHYVFQRQYAHVYYHRLADLGPRCWESIPHEDGVARIERILDLPEEKVSVAVGTLIKDQGDSKKSKPVLDQSVNTDNNQCTDMDALYLEDESGRVHVQMPPTHQHALVTGVVVGVKGTVGLDGIMQATDVFYPKQSPCETLKPEGESDADAKVLILSGLNASSTVRELLLTYLSGMVDTGRACQISRLLVGGRCESADLPVIDAMLTYIVGSLGIPVDIMPGDGDCTTAQWPQKPLFQGLIRSAYNSSSHGMLSLAPNPYLAQYKDKLVLAVDGVSVKSVQEQSLMYQGSTTVVTLDVVMKESIEKESQDTDANVTPEVVMEDANDSQATNGHTTCAQHDAWQPLSDMDALQRTLEWSHICPTGPDRVPTVPCLEYDPMVLPPPAPHVYIAMDCKAFATRVHESLETRLVCVPSFSQTGQAVLLHLDSCKVEVLQFRDSEDE